MIEGIFELNTIRIFLAIGMLGIATYKDIKEREITDYVWIVFGIIGIVLIFFEPNVIDFLTIMGIYMIIAPFGLVMWRLGLFGGADAFALIVLALIVPQVTLSNGIITPFTILINAVMLSIIPMLLNFARNIIQIAQKKDIFEGFEETAGRRILAMFIGYKAKNPKHSFSIEKKSGKYKKLKLSLQHAEYTPFCSTPNTWVTPGIPYMIFIMGGFVIQILYGDLIFNFLS